MKITVNVDQKIQVVSKENSNIIEVTTSKGRTVEFANVPPKTWNYDVKSWFGTKTKSVPVELKTRLNEFLDYSTDGRSKKTYMSTGALNVYPLWPCVKWQFLGDDKILMFNFVRNKLSLHNKSPILMEKGIVSIRNNDAELKINMQGVLEIEQDLLERVLEVDSESKPSAPEKEAPPPYDGNAIKNVVKQACI